jgi:hypothetical protein
LRRAAEAIEQHAHFSRIEDGRFAVRPTCFSIRDAISTEKAALAQLSMHPAMASR